MSSAPIITLRSNGDADEPVLHLLPCKIELENGPRVECETDAYFGASMREVGTDEGGQPIYAASFRGRPLMGVELSLPQSYAGVVLNEAHHSSDLSNRHFGTSARFSALYYWNLQTPPTPSDKVAQCFTWVDLAEALHASVPLENSTEPQQKQP